ncbi:MAG: DUF2945 domain-containing protein [Bacteroidota bacterium]|jgi:hypothetical protein|nr:DUF2945 domain-containing protein [Bacteroidota bacterium]
MIKVGSKVKWKLGNEVTEGKVVETYTDEITKTLKGSVITRKGKKNNKALLIEQEDGTKVLKLEEEVERV